MRRWTQQPLIGCCEELDLGLSLFTLRVILWQTKWYVGEMALKVSEWRCILELQLYCWGCLSRSDDQMWKHVRVEWPVWHSRYLLPLEFKSFHHCYFDAVFSQNVKPVCYFINILISLKLRYELMYQALQQKYSHSFSLLCFQVSSKREEAPLVWRPKLTAGARDTELDDQMLTKLAESWLDLSWLWHSRWPSSPPKNHPLIIVRLDRFAYECVPFQNLPR